MGSKDSVRESLDSGVATKGGDGGKGGGKKERGGRRVGSIIRYVKSYVMNYGENVRCTAEGEREEEREYPSTQVRKKYEVMK